MSDTPKPKRRNGLDTRRIWERLNFELAALSIVQKSNQPATQNFLTQRINELNEEIRKQRKKAGVFIQNGRESVLFFLNNPAYIDRMKAEMAARYQARRDGRNIREDELSDPVLADHCREHALRIFERNGQPGGGEWSENYKHIRHNYAETMGRACLAAEAALYLVQHAVATVTPAKTTPVPAQPTQPQPAPVQPKVKKAEPISPSGLIPKANWETFSRPSEEELNQLLGNRCDDNVPDDRAAEESSTTSTFSPKKVAKKKYYQPLFPFMNTRS